MARRSESTSTVVRADSWSTVWRCRCGYDNAGRERCLMCGSRAPAEARETPGLNADQHDGRDGRTSAGKAGRKATKTVVKIIVANVVLTGFEIGYFSATDMPVARAAGISFVTGLVFYALCAAWVQLRAFDLGLQARWGRARARHGAMEGFVVGGVTAVFLAALLRVVFGRPILDPTASLLASSSVPILLLGVVLIVVAAPLVEEFVFRGFLLEAFRGKGKWAAIMLSSVAFSVAHLNPAQFRYYVAMGITFALIYWRRGLVGSIAAHATFNGMLVVFAIAASHGPVIDVEFAGSHVAIPGTYQSRTDVLGDDLYVVGPGGQTIEFAHIFPRTVPSARDIAGMVVRGGLPLPPSLVTIDASSVTVTDLPAGTAVSVTADVLNRPGRIVILPSTDRMSFAIFRSDGTFRSTQEFDAILYSWRPAPAPV